MESTEAIIRECQERASSRPELWTRFLNAVEAKRVLELGVARGRFAAELLEGCPQIETYTMLDPWRNLEDWNKPANRDNEVFETFFAEAKAATDFARDKRVILRGKTTEVIDQIGDEELDFAYVDGDHTLRGIAVDLIRVYPKVRKGGWIGGDDFKKSIWQHSTAYEPTLVFPFAVHFAEAVGARIYGLSRSQFLIEKGERDNFEFIDLTGKYRDLTLGGQIRPGRLLRLRLKELFGGGSRG